VTTLVNVWASLLNDIGPKFIKVYIKKWVRYVKLNVVLTIVNDIELKFVKVEI
jgi:hypothetical protein